MNPLTQDSYRRVVQNFKLILWLNLIVLQVLLVFAKLILFM
jgi:hypothetical protein